MKNAITIKAVLLFAEAWLALGMARLILLFIPFRRIISRSKSVPPAAEYDINKYQSFVRHLSLAITRAARRCPWRTKCFEQALAARMMLKVRHIPYLLTFGVRKQESTGELKAHAWLKVNDFIVTGGDIRLQQFTIVGNFNG